MWDMWGTVTERCGLATREPEWGAGGGEAAKGELKMYGFSVREAETDFAFTRFFTALARASAYPARTPVPSPEAIYSEVHVRPTTDKPPSKTRLIFAQHIPGSEPDPLRTGPASPTCSHAVRTSSVPSSP